MMAEAVYALCALTATGCAVLLWRGYRHSRSALLLWSGLGFLGLAINNVLLFIDLVLVPAVDLSVIRNVTAFLAVSVTLGGLIWETTQ